MHERSEKHLGDSEVSRNMRKLHDCTQAFGDGSNRCVELFYKGTEVKVICAVWCCGRELKTLI